MTLSPDFVTSPNSEEVDPQPELRAMVWGCQSCGWQEDPDERIKNARGGWHPPSYCPLCDTRGMKGIRGLTAETWDALNVKKKWSPFADEDEDEPEEPEEIE